MTKNRAKNYWLNGGAASHATAHVAAYGMGGGTVENNYAEHCHVGIYCEHGEKGIIRGNDLRDISLEAIQVVAAYSDINHFTIEDNLIELRDDNPFRRVAIALGASGAHRVRSVYVANNKSYIKTTGNTVGPGPTGISTSLDTGLGYTVLANKFDPTLLSSVAADTVKYYNRTHAGAVIATLPDSALVAGAVTFPTAAGATGDIFTLTSPTVAGWSARSTFTQFEAQKMTSFTPSGTGWYRIAIGENTLAGTFRIRASYNSKETDLEFSVSIRGYAVGVGEVHQYRNLAFNGGHVSQARISSNGAAIVYLDINIADATSPSTMTIHAYGAGLPAALVSAPVTGATPGVSDEKIVPFGTGILTSSVFAVNGTQVMGARDTGWGAMTGTPSKAVTTAVAAGTASVGYTQAELQTALNRIAAIEGRLKAYDDAFFAHGLIGA